MRHKKVWLILFLNLLLLPVAWYVYSSHQAAYAIVVGAVALAVLGLLFSPSAVQWASGRRSE